MRVNGVNYGQLGIFFIVLHLYYLFFDYKRKGMRHTPSNMSVMIIVVIIMKL